VKPARFLDLKAGVEQAERLLSSGDWRGAEEAYRVLVSSAAAQRDGANRLVLLDRLADIAITVGDSVEADAIYAALVSEYERQSDWTSADIARLKRVHVRLSGEQLSEGVDLLREVEPRTGGLEGIRFTEPQLTEWEGLVPWTGPGRTLALALFYLESGRVLSATGQFDEAGEAFRRGLRHADGEPEMARSALAFRLDLTCSLMERGDLKAAREGLAEISDDDLLHAPAAAARFREILAKVNLLEGNLGTAESELAATLDLCRKIGSPRCVARAAVNLAELRVALNRIPEARANLDEAAAAAGPEIEAHVARVRMLAEHREGSVYDDEELALPVLALQMPMKNASATVGSSGLGWDTGETFQAFRPVSLLSFYEMCELECLVRLNRGDLRGAQTAFRWISRDFSACKSIIVGARLQVLEAALDGASGDWKRAEGLLRTSFAEFRNAGLRGDLYQCGRLIALCLKNLKASPEEVLVMERENDALLDEIAHTLGKEEREIYLLNKWSAWERELGREVDALAMLEKESAALRGWRRIIKGYSVLAQRNAIVNRIEAHRAQEDREPRRVPLWRRVLAPSSRSAQIGFVSLPNCTFTWLGSRYRIRSEINQATRIRIRELVAAWHRNAPAQDPRSRIRVSRAGQELSASLGIPKLLSGLIPRLHEIVFCPDDQLHGFPFAALPLTGEPDPEYAGLKFAVSVSVAAPRKRANRRIRSAVIAGVANSTGFDSLSGLATQCEWVRGWLSQRGVVALVLREQEVTRIALTSALSGAEMLHFAGHGVLRSGDPEASGLVLAQADSEGRIFGIRDLVTARFDRLDHATIAACWTGDSLVFPGGRTIGFASLLLKAGARSVTAPLWEVEDKLSGEILKVFYEQCAKHPRAEALRLARLEMREKGCLDPYWWAAFQLYGESSRLRFPR
jgi:CHAT domain-containing protein/tetratricopeptide (TPR) repeat protein